MTEHKSIEGKEFIVIFQQMILNEGNAGISYDWDFERFDTLSKAKKHGFKTRGSDDFNVGIVKGDCLIDFTYMGESLGESAETLKEIAEYIDLKVEEPHLNSRNLLERFVRFLSTKGFIEKGEVLVHALSWIDEFMESEGLK